MAAIYIHAPRAGMLSKVVAEIVANNEMDAVAWKALIRIGCIYHQSASTVPVLSSEDRKRGLLPKLSMKRVISDQLIAGGDALRIYPNPRRHPVNKIAWKDLILKETDEYIIINKPPSIPCHATADNATENVLFQLQEYLDRNHNGNPSEGNSPQNGTNPDPVPPSSDSSDVVYMEPLRLYLPQRLDTDTSGLLMIAKTTAWISWLGSLLRKKLYRKLYKTLICYQVPAALSSVVDRPNTVAGTLKEDDEVLAYLLKTSITPKRYSWQISNSQDTLVVSSPPKMASSSSATSSGAVTRKWEQPRSAAIDEAKFEHLEARLRFAGITSPIAKSLSAWKEWLNEKRNFHNNLYLVNTKDAESLKSRDDKHFLNAMEYWLHNIATREKNESKNTADSDLIVIQELTLELLTGRTHQIRGQLQILPQHPAFSTKMKQAIGIHVAGDNMYRGASSHNDELHVSPYLALQSYAIELNAGQEFTDNQEIKRSDPSYRLERCWWAMLYDK